MTPIARHRLDPRRRSPPTSSTRKAYATCRRAVAADWSIDGARPARCALAEPVAGLEHLVLPLDPMIGCFGVAPSRRTGLFDRHQRREWRQHGLSPPRAGRQRPTFPFRRRGRAVLSSATATPCRVTARSPAPGVETAIELEVRLSRGAKAQKLGPGRAARPRTPSSPSAMRARSTRPCSTRRPRCIGWLQWPAYGLSAAGRHAILLGQVVRYEVGNVYDPPTPWPARSRSAGCRRGEAGVSPVFFYMLRAALLLARQHTARTRHDTRRGI
jgi:hypothetical protein